MSSGSGPEAIKKARDEAKDGADRARNEVSSTSSSVRQGADSARDRIGRAASGSKVSDGSDDSFKGNVGGGGATPRNVPMFGVGVAVVILILLVLAYFVFR